MQSLITAHGRRAAEGDNEASDEDLLDGMSRQARRLRLEPATAPEQSSKAQGKGRRALHADSALLPHVVATTCFPTNSAMLPQAAALSDH